MASAPQARADRATGSDAHADDAATAHGRPHSVPREYFESAIVTFIMALFFMTFVGQAAAVPTASMENTIMVGDHFLINKFVFANGDPSDASFLPQRTIRRGDVIVFKYPSDINTDEQVVRYQTFFIKRVIGLPGETVEVRGANVLINGQPLPEHRIVASDPNLGNDKAALKDLSDTPRRPDEPYSVYYSPRTLARQQRGLDDAMTGFTYGVDGQAARVPDDHYFVMGDNRDNSSDSRVWGFVPKDLVVGRAMFIIWSYDESAPADGNFLVNFFKNTRWNRTGTLIK